MPVNEWIATDRHERWYQNLHWLTGYSVRQRHRSWHHAVLGHIVGGEFFVAKFDFDEAALPIAATLITASALDLLSR